MTILSRCLQAPLLICALGASLDLAAEPSLKYREISFGDTPERVMQQATSEFLRIKMIAPKSTTDVLAIEAGDDQGMQGNFCAFAATSNRQKNCLSASFYFSSQMQGTLLHKITIEQSFNPPVVLDALLKKLATTYGKTRLTFKENIPANYNSPESKLTALLWGGNKTPTNYNRLYSRGYEGMVAIGGKFISAEIYHQDNTVNGYRLEIIDSDSVIKTNRESMAEVDRMAAARRKTNEASIKF